MKDEAANALCGIAYDLDVRGNLASEPIDIEKRRNLLLVFKESVYNAARHSKGTHVGISFQYDGRMFSMVIADNGVGFDPALEHEGNGVRNLEYRAKSTGATFAIESRPGNGTKVIFTAKIP
jgi:signal transduction histidine kinase